jgi:hypothetical protein
MTRLTCICRKSQFARCCKNVRRWVDFNLIEVHPAIFATVRSVVPPQNSGFRNKYILWMTSPESLRFCVFTNVITKAVVLGSNSEH